MIPLKVYTDNGCLTDNLDIVLDKWKTDYQLLYNTGPPIDNDFIIHISNVLYNYDNRLHVCTSITDTDNVFLNDPIAL